MNFPLVTVIVPSYNHARYVGNAIRSVIEQTYPEWELIVVDDGSSDGTPAVLEQFAAHDRIQVLCNPINRGQSAVVNQALAIARGKFVCFLPSDDWFLPDKLELQVARFLELDESYGVVYGRGQRFYEDTGETVSIESPQHSGWVLKQLVERNFVYPITPMFRRECFERFPFDESYRAEGEAIYLKLALAYKFAFVPDFVGVMRDHSSNTGKDADMMLSDNLRYWQEFFARPDLPAEIRGMRDWRISRLKRVKGLDFVTLKQRPTEGRALLLDSVRTWPRGALDWRIWAAVGLSFLPADWVKNWYAKRNARSEPA
jgi:glycosyltransferase involved in cell wall biosynthesis